MNDLETEINNNKYLLVLRVSNYLVKRNAGLSTATEGNYYAINTAAIVYTPSPLNGAYQNNNGNPPVNPNPNSTPTAVMYQIIWFFSYTLYY